jgi:TonB family protein
MRLSNIKMLELQAMTVAVIIHITAISLYGIFSSGITERVFASNPIKISFGGDSGGFRVEYEPVPEEVVSAEPAPEVTPQKAKAKQKPAKKILASKPASKVSELAPAAGNASALAEQKNTSEQKYLSLVQNWVQNEAALTPNSAKGQAVLRLEFNRQGLVTRYQLVKSTGNAALDKAALELAAKFTKAPLPKPDSSFYLNENLLRFDFNVDYN